MPPTVPGVSTLNVQPCAVAHSRTLAAVTPAPVESRWQPGPTSTAPLPGSVTTAVLLAGTFTARSRPAPTVSNAAPTVPRTVGVVPAARVSPPGCGLTLKRL